MSSRSFIALACRSLQVVLEYDRSAARGMGSIKCSGNYGADLLPSAEHKAPQCGMDPEAVVGLTCDTPKVGTS